MTVPKRSVSLLLDPAIAAELEAADDVLVQEVCDALRDALGRRPRQRLLRELLQDLDREHGPVPEALVAKYMALLE